MSRKRKNATAELVREMYGGEVYEYIPLGKYIVAAPDVCGGRPTIKYHRLDARHVLGDVRNGETPEQIAADYDIPVAAVYEVIALASQYDYERNYV